MSHFQFPIKVFVEDTDYGGIVYHPNYLKFMERARTEWLNSVGVSLKTAQDNNILFIVRKANVHYHKPAALNDCLIVDTHATPIKNTRLIFTHHIVKKDDPGIICCTGEVEVVCTNQQKKPIRLPSILLEKLA